MADGSKSSFEALRQLHHALAREAAAGRSVQMLATLNGMTTDQVRGLMDSPAFRELVARYRRAA